MRVRQAERRGGWKMMREKKLIVLFCPLLDSWKLQKYLDVVESLMSISHTVKATQINECKQ